MTEEFSCGRHDEWNDECAVCRIRKHIRENYDAYIRMGEI